MIAMSDEISKALAEAGWREGRRRPVTTPIASSHPGLKILESLAGLKIGKSGPGKECASSDVIFEPIEDKLDDVLVLEALLGETLVGIAEIHNGHGQLHVDTRGRCFGVSLMHSAAWLEGETLDVALCGLLAGLKPSPILLPGQESTELFGETYLPGDARLVRFD